MILMIATFANLGAGLYEAFPEVRPHALDFTYTGIACLFSGIIAYRMSIDKIFKLGDKNYNEKKKWRLEKI